MSDSGGMAAGAGQFATQDYQARQASALELKMKSSLIDQQAQQASEQSAQESEQRKSEASYGEGLKQQQALFALAHAPKVAQPDIDAIVGMAGPRADPNLNDKLQGLIGQPVSKLQDYAEAAAKFKLGSGQTVPLRDGNGIHIADRFTDPNTGDPHDLPIAGAAEKSNKAGAIMQYQNYMKILIADHDRLSGFDPVTHEPLKDANGNPIHQFATTGPWTKSITKGQLGGGALSLEGELGYNDVAADFNKTHAAMLNLANKVLEEGPSRTSEALLNLSREGQIDIDTKNSVMHTVSDRFMDLTNTEMSELRQLAHTGDGLPPSADQVIGAHRDDAVKQARSAKAARLQQILNPTGK